MNNLRLPLWIGLRYTRSREKNRFLSLLSWFSLAGMSLGVAALIVVLSVMNGFQREVRDRLLDLVAHGQVEKTNDSAIADWQKLVSRIEQTPGIIAAAPMAGGDVMLSNGRSLRAVVLQGVDVNAEQRISPIAERTKIGSFATLETERYGIVLGISLARALGLFIGDQVLVTLPQLTITPFGVRPRVRQFVVVGIFEVGADVDGTHAYIHLRDAQRLYALAEGVHSVRFLTDNIMQAEQRVQLLQQQLADDFNVSSWMEQRVQLFSAIRMEKRLIGFMLGLVVLVAACNLVSLLSMMVASKRDEIAVLRMMGLSRAGVLAIFLTQGLSLSLFGIVMGAVLGLILAAGLPDLIRFAEQYFQLYVFDPDVFYISGLPSEIQMADVYRVVLSSLMLSIIFSLYPALQASKIEPVEALQYQ